MNQNKPMENFGNNVLLAVMEYVLEVGVAGALSHIKENVPMEDIKVFPFVYDEIEKMDNLISSQK